MSPAAPWWQLLFLSVAVHHHGEDCPDSLRNAMAQLVKSVVILEGKDVYERSYVFSFFILVFCHEYLNIIDLGNKDGHIWSDMAIHLLQFSLLFPRDRPQACLCVRSCFASECMADSCRTTSGCCQVKGVMQMVFDDI